LTDAGFFIFDRDSKSCLKFLGLMDGIYNESGVGATLDEGTICNKNKGSKKYVLAIT
jgi:hypothetical protein